MLPSDQLLVPVRQLGTHRRDSVLSLLVAAIGVSLVVSMTALLAGLQQAGADALRLAGACVVRVHHVPVTPEDARILAQGPDRVRAVPISGRNSAVSAGDVATPATLVATVPAYRELFGHPLGSGRFLSDEDARGAVPGCVLDGALARTLFGEADPLGHPLAIAYGQRALEVSVRGVLVDLSSREQLGVHGILPNRNLYLHLRHPAVEAHLGAPSHTLLVEAQGPEAVAALVQGLEGEAAGRWPGGHYTVRDSAWVARTNAEFARMMNGLGLALAVVTVLSCVVSVATLKLVALRGRTGEIAVRVIEGATPRLVATQFLLESTITSGLGAVLGLPLGWALATWLGAHHVGWPVVFSPQLAGVALLAASLSGVAAGALPAWRAARLDPVQSLRGAREAGC